MIPQFRNLSLWQTALTHRSALNENLSESKVSNERLEFLGDAVLELLTTEFLYHQFPDLQEGELTAYRSGLVKTETLGVIAKRLNLGQQLIISRGEESAGGRNNPSLLADVFEAVVGALFLDQGLEVVRQFLINHLFNELPTITARDGHKDAKSQLQEISQARGWGTPVYQTVSSSGPDHDKEFVVQVVIDDKVKGEGRGKSKQLAQQQAAKQAIEQIP